MAYCCLFGNLRWNSSASRSAHYLPCWYLFCSCFHVFFRASIGYGGEAIRFTGCGDLVGKQKRILLFLTQSSVTHDNNPFLQSPSQLALFFLVQRQNCAQLAFLVRFLIFLAFCWHVHTETSPYNGLVYNRLKKCTKNTLRNYFLVQCLSIVCVYIYNHTWTFTFLYFFYVEIRLWFWYFVKLFLALSVICFLPFVFFYNFFYVNFVVPFILFSWVCWGFCLYVY